MYLKRIADEIAALVNDTTLGSSGTNYARTKMWIRDCYFNDILARANDWWFLRKIGFIQTAAEINAGTISVTKGSATVTGSGTAFTSAVNNRLLIVGGKSARIDASGYVSGTSLTLDYEWEHDTVSAQAYTIVKDRYALPRWLDPKRLIQIKPNGYRKLEGRSKQELDSLHTGGASYGTPKEFAVVDKVRSEYSTGTVTLTSSSKTVTGASTSWTSSELEQFDKLTVGNNAYSINTINSDTSITLYENASTSESASTYIALMDRFYIELYPAPSELRVLAVLGTTLPPQLDDDSDVSMLPDEFYQLLVKGAYIRALKHNGDGGVTNELAEFQFALKRLISSNNRDDYRTESWWK